MKIHRFLIAIALLFSTGIAGSAELPGRDRYAYRFPLDITGESGFFAVELPLEAYRSVADPLLRDTGVYNGNGEPVPRIFEHSPEDKNGPEQVIPLGLVPLHGELADHSDQLRIFLQQGTAGTRLELDASTSEEPDKDRMVTAYIIDTRDLEHRLEALEFSWQPLLQGLIATVRIDHSDDLQHWRKLGAWTLAEVEYEGTRIEQRRIGLDKDVAGFLRVTWKKMPELWRLEKVAGIWSGRGVQAPRDWLTLEVLAPGDDEREFIFDAAGFPPVDRVNLLLTGTNAVVRASVFHRLTPEDRWTRLYSGVFYNLSRQGSDLQSPATAVRETRAGHWKIRIDAGTAPDPVRLQLGWRPDRLLFLAQGPPPFELVSGRARDRLEQFPQSALMGDREIFDLLRESGQEGLAIIGSREIVAGPAQLEITHGGNWKTALLWLGLAGAVALVAWMVYSLMREMKNG